ncbi:MAG: sigma-70 family RNA polymerase sigma factor [Verrucomicrobia bacterium]|nr:sigma-70 family RNA polymerase sigma factor [Verrucomicrobiota bacterium]
MPTEATTGAPSTHRHGGVFITTRWSVVLAAKDKACPDSAAALETLCRTYWYPLYAFVRRCGSSPQDAQDSTQEFFRLLLEKRWLDQADREKGRLRTFLITALKHFMAKEWRRQSAQKRGGGQDCIPMDTEFAESRYAADPVASSAADEVFDRQWALTLLELAMARLEGEFANAGRAGDFTVLKEFLALSHGTIDYRSAAARLHISEGNARVAVHRLRKRFRELYREAISQTLPDDADLDAELRHLANALARS